MFSSFIKNSSRVFRSKQDTILSAAFVIATVYSLSALLGFVKNRILSGYFGDSSELGIFFGADDVPSLVFSLIVSGSLAAAFIPVYTKVRNESEKKAFELTNSLLNTSLVLVLIFVVIVYFTADTLVKNVFARNTSLTISEMHLMASLMRTMMIAQVIFVISTFFTSILQSNKHFIIPAIAPVMYNIGQIIFIVMFVRVFGIYAPVYGMIFGSLLHMGIQLPFVRKVGYRYSFRLNFKDRDFKEFYSLLIPRILGQAIYKFMIPLYTNLAYFISASANVVLTFGGNISNVPLRIFGMAIGQAALPILSLTYIKGDIDEFKKLLIKTLHQIAFFVLPVSIVMFVLKIPLVRLAVGAEKYSWESTVMTAYTLGFYSIALIAQSLIIILSRSFYAVRNTKTPVIIAIVSLSINATLAMFFVKYLHLWVWSLALATLIGSFIQMFFLFVFLIRHLGNVKLVDIIEPINRIAISSFIMGIFLYIPFKAMDEFVFNTTKTLDLLILTTVVSVFAFIVYIYISKLLKIEELTLVIHVFKKLKKSVA